MSTKKGKISHITITELLNLINKRWTWISFLMYTLFTFTVYFSKSFRESRIELIDGNIFITLTNQYLPFFLIATILIVVSPLFAADKKIGMEELGDTCRNGKWYWKLSKIIASILYMLISVAVGFIVAIFMSSISNTPLNFEMTAFESANPDIAFNNAQFYLFSFTMILIGMLFIVLVILLISSKTNDSLIPLASVGLFCGIEAVLFALHAPYYLWDLNIFRLLTPYSLLFDSSSLFSPALRAIIIIISIYMVLSCFLMWMTLRNVTRDSERRRYKQKLKGLLSK